ncbi:MAG: hypothetical protein ACAH59_11020 [Pseudobdellovibrionaceae bacterium]
MRLDLATAEDNLKLVEFFKEFPIKGMIELKVDRNKDFFAPYSLQSDNYHTYLLKDEEATIQGAASFIIRDTSTEGKLCTVATATDLRVRPNRRAILQWSQHFLPVLEKEAEKNHISSVFSAINLSDPTVLNTFIRPRNMKRAMPRYYLYRRFRMVSLHGRYPWAKRPLSSLRIRQGSEATADAIAAYIIRRSQYRPFASVWDIPSFEKKLQRLTGMKISDFWVAFDSDENVIGCMAPWSASGIQDLIPLSYSLRAHNFRQFLKFCWLLGLTRRMAKPVVSTGIESKFQFRYLTNLFCDNEDVFESLLYTTFESLTNQEFLLYAHAEQDYRLLPPENWVSASLPYALYAVTPPDKEMPSFLHPSISLNPEIEAYTIL